MIDLAEESQIEEGISWWKRLTDRGGEGMVVKPLDFVVRGKKGLVQPAVKCRGREYLRIIYGPEYDAPENLVRLRSRGLGAKRSLACKLRSESRLSNVSFAMSRYGKYTSASLVFSRWRANRLIRAFDGLAEHGTFAYKVIAQSHDRALPPVRDRIRGQPAGRRRPRRGATDHR